MNFLRFLARFTGGLLCAVGGIALLAITLAACIAGVCALIPVAFGAWMIGDLGEQPFAEWLDDVRKRIRREEAKHA